MSPSIFMPSAVLACAMLAAPSSFAQGRSLGNEASTHQLTMAQAVVIAESMGNGRAMHARLEPRVAPPVYRIMVKAPNEAPLRIDVAAADGRIVASERRKD